MIKKWVRIIMGIVLLYGLLGVVVVARAEQCPDGCSNCQCGIDWINQYLPDYQYNGCFTTDTGAQAAGWIYYNVRSHNCSCEGTGDVRVLYSYNGADKACAVYAWDGVCHDPPPDADGDGVYDDVDNCINTANPNQQDLDGDGIGDVCDDDIDGDGIPNNVDPSMGADSGEAYCFDAVQAFDADGNCVYKEIWMANANGEIIGIKTVGDQEEYNAIRNENQPGTIREENPYVNPFDYPGDYDVYNIENLDERLGQDINGDQQEIPLSMPDNDQTETEVESGSSNQDGAADPGATTTTEMKDYSGQLGTIIGNQVGQMANQGRQADKTDTTNNLLREMSKKMGKTSVGVTVNNNGPTADEIGQSVADKMGSGDSIQTAIDGVTNPTLTGYGVEEIPVENSITDQVTGFLSSNPIAGIINGSGVTASGACSVDCNIPTFWGGKGHTIQFSMCDYADELATWGTVINAIAMMVAIFIICV